jgi:hypothetical protein
VEGVIEIIFMNEPITTTYKGIVITYKEDENIWSFVLRDRDRTARSLLDAKEIIDKPVPVKNTPFARFDAWHSNYSGISKCVVTGIAEKKYNDDAVWISSATGRTKQEAKTIIPSSPEIDAQVEHALKLRKDANELLRQAEKIICELPRYTVPTEQ